MTLYALRNITWCMLSELVMSYPKKWSHISVKQDFKNMFTNVLSTKLALCGYSLLASWLQGIIWTKIIYISQLCGMINHAWHIKEMSIHILMMLSLGTSAMSTPKCYYLLKEFSMTNWVKIVWFTALGTSAVNQHDFHKVLNAKFPFYLPFSFV